MRKTTLWLFAVWCLFLSVPAHAIAQAPWSDALGRIILEDLATDREIFRQRELPGELNNKSTPSRRHSLNRRSAPAPARQTSTDMFLASAPLAPKRLAAAFPVRERGEMEAFFTLLLILYPSSAERMGLPANDLLGATTFNICANLQMASQRRIPASHCAATYRQLRRSLVNDRELALIYALAGATEKRLAFEQIAVSGSFFDLMFRSLQERPDPYLQARLAARADQNIRTLFGAPASEMHITAQGLSQRRRGIQWEFYEQ